MAELIQKTDTLNEGREKLNEAIKDAGKAKIDSSEALDTANTALSKSESTQTQLDNIVVDGDSSIEAAQARVDKDNHNYSTLKERLDAEQEIVEEVDSRLTSQLAQKATVYRQTRTYNIPTDYPDLQTAINDLSEIKSKNLVNIELLIESGHELINGLQVENGDFSNFIISSEDDVVTLNNNYVGVTNTIEGNNQNIESFLIFGSNARMPVLNCLIDMNNIGSAGYYATNSSNGFINPNCGVINSPFTGIEARASVISAEKSIANGCYYGYRAQQGGVIFAQQGNADDCQSDGLLASRGSTIQFAEGSAKNGVIGARAQRSRIVAIHADFSGSQTAIQAQEASDVSAFGAKGQQCRGTSVLVTTASKVDISNFDGSNSTRGIRALSGSTVNAGNANFDYCSDSAIEVDGSSRVNIASGTVKYCQGTALTARGASNISANELDCSHANNYGVRAYSSSNIDFSNGIATDCGNAGMMAVAGSTINGNGSDVSRSNNSAGAVVSQRGSTINAVDCNASESEGVGFSVFAGGIITANGSTGELVQDQNTVTGRGIIFKGN